MLLVPENLSPYDQFSWLLRQNRIAIVNSLEQNLIHITASIHQRHRIQPIRSQQILWIILNIISNCKSLKIILLYIIYYIMLQIFFFIKIILIKIWENRNIVNNIYENYIFHCINIFFFFFCNLILYKLVIILSNHKFLKKIWKFIIIHNIFLFCIYVDIILKICFCNVYFMYVIKISFFLYTYTKYLVIGIMIKK